MSKLISALTNETLTENGAITYKSTLDGLLDFFALGGAMRNRSESDIVDLFNKAYNEDAASAVQMLFYFRDVRGGQGERRLFKVILPTLVNKLSEDKMFNLIAITADYGRYDDLYSLVGTKCEDMVFKMFKTQLVEDLNTEFPSLLGKWLKSENASSLETQRLGRKTRKALGLTSKQYRKTLSLLRSRINIVETKMTNGEWSEIDYAKLPSKAGFQYRRAFLRNDEDRYTDFMTPKDGATVKVNAGTMYPYEIVSKVLNQSYSRFNAGPVERAALNAYWENLPNYIAADAPNAIAVVDVSGSMTGTPMEVAVSLGLYTAERNTGKFHNHFITFSSEPQLVELNDNDDFVGKVVEMKKADWGMSTDVKKSFDLVLNTAKRYNLPQSEMPEIMYIISDMEFDRCARRNDKALFEIIREEYNRAGYTMPHLVFWNVDARNNNIPMVGKGDYSLVSGFSPVIFEMVAKRKTAMDLMLDTINQDRYLAIKEIMNA